MLTHQQQQEQHLSHLDRVGIVFQKYRVRFQRPPEWENPRGNSNRIKYQSYTGIWVNYTVRNSPKSRGFGGWGLNCHNIPTDGADSFLPTLLTRSKQALCTLFHQGGRQSVPRARSRGMHAVIN